MRYLIPFIAVIMVMVAIPASLLAAEPVRHDLKVVLYPNEQRFTAEDTITVPEALVPGLQFVLHKGLQPSSPTAGVDVVRDGKRTGADFLEAFRATLPPGRNTFVLEYGGTIHHLLE